jgi:hypothetical protein
MIPNLCNAGVPESIDRRPHLGSKATDDAPRQCTSSGSLTTHAVLSVREAAELLGIPEQTLGDMIGTVKLPQFEVLPRTFRMRRPIGPLLG